MRIIRKEEIQLLKTVPLFRKLKEDELEIIVLTTKNIIYEPQEVIFNEGDEGDEAYIICSGQVEVFRKAADGKVVIVNKLGQGCLFGELALFGNGFRTASVKAIEETLVSVISKEKLYEIIRAFPEIAIEMLRVITERFAQTENRLMASITRK
jgi:CRP-like cAMP-binding protein